MYKFVQLIKSLCTNFILTAKILIHKKFLKILGIQYFWLALYNKKNLTASPTAGTKQRARAKNTPKKKKKKAYSQPIDCVFFVGHYVCMQNSEIQIIYSTNGLTSVA